MVRQAFQQRINGILTNERITAGTMISGEAGDYRGCCLSQPSFEFDIICTLVTPEFFVISNPIFQFTQLSQHDPMDYFLFIRLYLFTGNAISLC